MRRELGDSDPQFESATAGFSHVLDDIMSVILLGRPLTQQECFDRNILYHALEDPKSPIEKTCAYALYKYAKRAGLKPQHAVKTPHGGFRFDFYIDVKGYRVVIECDGKNYHDPFRDEWRDALVLGYNLADVVYRFPGSSIWRDIDLCLYTASKLDPVIFTPRGRANLEALSEPVEWEVSGPCGENIVAVLPDETKDGGRESTSISITRRDRRDIAKSDQPRWVQLYEFASSMPSIRLDPIINEWCRL